jgi:homoserine kinase type II
MAVLTAASFAEVRALLLHLGLGELRALTGIPAGSVNSNFALDLEGGKRLFLRIYEEQDEDGARREASLLQDLAAAGVRTPAPLAPIAHLSGKPAAVFPWREGGIRCQRTVSTADVRKVGEALARVHAAGTGLREPPRPSRFGEADLLLRISRIARAEDPALAAQAAPLREKLVEWSARRDAGLPRGLIHGDLFRDNVLWERADQGEIAALLDFESASEGVFAYDLMVTALAWCVGDTLDAGLVREMIAGYESVRALTAAEQAGLVAEGCAAALRFTITRITDYAMRVTDGPRVIKDWQRFAMRLAALESIERI